MRKANVSVLVRIAYVERASVSNCDIEYGVDVGGRLSANACNTGHRVKLTR